MNICRKVTKEVKGGGLRTYIEDFEKQLLRIETNRRGYGNRVNKSKIKRSTQA